MDRRRIADAQRFLRANGLDGWLLFDFQQTNPVFWQLLGQRRHTTRRVYLLVPPEGEPRFLAHRIDVTALAVFGAPIETYVTWQDLHERLRAFLGGLSQVVMEYSPGSALPVVGRVDAGTIELVRSLGIEVRSSAELLQYTIARWSDGEIASHERAATHLEAILTDAYDFIRANLEPGVTEHQVVERMRAQFASRGLMADDGPVAAVNAHSGDPHYEPSAEHPTPIRRGDWLLIDYWAREHGDDTAYADITWVAVVADRPTAEQQRVFGVVAGARDAALAYLEQAFQRGETVHGWQVDKVARDHVAAHGLAEYFTHRLGHSLGHNVHFSGVNLDNFETRDTRQLVPGIAVTVEPGVYLPEFGVRSEVNVLIGADGPRVTTPIQKEITCLLA